MLRDQEAFSELYRLHAARIFRHVYYMTGRKQDADDITAETFLRAWTAVHRFEDRGLPIENWLLKIAHNLAARHLKRARPTLPVEFAENETSPAKLPEQVVAEELEAASIRRAILKLPITQRQVIIWRFLEGMSYSEVEVMLGKSQGAIRVIQFRALAKLREALDYSVVEARVGSRRGVKPREKVEALGRVAFAGQPG